MLLSACPTYILATRFFTKVENIKKYKLLSDIALFWFHIGARSILPDYFRAPALLFVTTYAKLQTIFDIAKHITYFT